MSLQTVIIVITLAAFAVLGFMMNNSIKKHDAAKAKMKKKKGRSKYMPQVKNPGK